MPMIKVETTESLSPEERNTIKTQLGKAISVMGKPESYLMINIADNQDMYFGGNKMDKGAYVEVKVLGNVDSAKSAAMTEKVCDIFQSELSIPGDGVYVSYWGTDNWGWNGSNF